MLLVKSSDMNSYLQFMTVLVIFVIVLAITWFCTKWLSNIQKGRTTGSNIEIIETCQVAANKHIQIVRIGEKYLGIAVCKDTITMLTEIPEEQIQILKETGMNMPDFKSIFEKVKKMDKNQKNEE